MQIIIYQLYFIAEITNRKKYSRIRSKLCPLDSRYVSTSNYIVAIFDALIGIVRLNSVGTASSPDNLTQRMQTYRECKPSLLLSLGNIKLISKRLSVTCSWEVMVDRKFHSRHKFHMENEWIAYHN